MKHIDNLFKEELGSYTETPPPPAWDALEKRLKESRKKRAFPYRWFWYISLVSFIVLLGASVLWKMASNMHANAITSADNAMPAQTSAITTQTAPNSNNLATETNIASGKHTIQHHSKKATLIANSNETTKIVKHRSNKRKANEQINTTQNSKSKTNDDLYADTDDDQYTVGYSSGTRKNVTSLENETNTSEYATQQRRQSNIIVAETNPEQQVHENNYGSRSSIPVRKEITQQNASLAYQHNASSSQEYAGSSINAEDDDTHSRRHRYTKAIANNPVTHNVNKLTANEVPTTTAYAKKNPNAKSKKAVPVNVVAASTPVIKTNITKQAVAVAPVKKNKHKHARIINTQPGMKKVASDSYVTSSTTVIKTKKVKQVAVTALANEPVKAISSQISNKKTTSESSIASSVHAIKAKTPKTASTKNNKDEHVLAANTNTRVNGNTPPSENKIASSTPVVKTKATKQVDAVTSVKQAKETTIEKTNTQRKKQTIASHRETDKTIASASTVKNKKHMPPKQDRYATTIVNTNSVSAKTDKREVVLKKKVANAPIAANTATVSVSKHHKQKKDVIKENNAVKPVLSSAVPGSDIKSTKDAVANHKIKAKKGIALEAKNTAAAENNQVSSASNTVAKHKKAADKQPRVKADKQVDVVAANLAIDKPVKNKHLPSDKVVGDEVAAATENKAAKTKQTKKAGKADKKTAAEQPAIAENENKAGKKETTRKRSGNKNAPASTPPATPPPAFVYNNAISKRNLEDETVIIDNLKVNKASDPRAYASKNDGDMIPGTFKQDVLKAAKPDSTITNAGTPADSAVKHSLFSRHFEAGIKGGYETAFTKGGANKFVISPYIQYNLSDKFSVMTQPSVKVSHLGNISLDGTKSFVDPKTGSITPLDSGVVVVVPGGPGFYLRRYTYTQIYDSVVKSYGLSHTYMEFELPLLVKYKIYKQLSVYGGVNIVFGKEISIAENTYTSGPLTASRIGGTLSSVGAPPPAEPPVSSVIKYPNPLISSYAGPLYPSPSGDLLRLGYMLGFSYEYKKRWLFDVLIQQATAKPNNEGGVNTNAPLSLPYFRFTLGYKLTK